MDCCGTKKKHTKNLHFESLNEILNHKKSIFEHNFFHNLINIQFPETIKNNNKLITQFHLTTLAPLYKMPQYYII